MHCEAGVSRSAAVGYAISEKLGLSCQTIMTDVSHSFLVKCLVEDALDMLES